MKSNKTYLIVSLTSLLLLSLFPVGHAQGILNRVLKRSKDKIEDKVEQAIVEKASDAIARRVYRSMSDAFDKMLRDAWEADSSRYADREGDSGNYAEWAATWMQRMNEAVDLPPSFSFDMRADVIIEDGKEKNLVILYLSATEPIFAMEQMEKKEKRIFLIDGEKDVVVLYMEDSKGNKTAQAIPNMISTVASIGRQQAESNDDFHFEKMNKTKKIAGYNSEGYRAWDEEYESEFYLTTELDIDWRDSFGGMVEKFSGSGSFSDQPMMNGFLMESHTTPKKKPKDKTSWLTQKVDNDTFTIQNADYTFGNMMDDN
jgi:hypothetical protein